MENSLSNKIQALTKSINMDNAVIGTFKRLFIIRVSYTQINLLKKLSSYGIVAKTRFSRFVFTLAYDREQAVVRKCFSKYLGVLKNFSIYTCAGVCFLFLIKLQAFRLVLLITVTRNNKCYEGSLSGSDS